jgi:hypothetical protein
MKKILRMLGLAVGLITLASSCSHQTSAGKPSAGDSVIYYPYDPVYTDSFSQGKKQYALTVLQLWKEWETGDLRRRSADFADSIAFILPDTIFRGKKEVVLENFQKRRQVYSDMQCYVDAWLPRRAAATGDELVFVWGRQDGTNQKGRRDYLVLHEVWRFDAGGRIAQLTQYLTHAH